ncbi:MAG: hypothetical protein AVDCRST_MAG39-2390 [uncultured Sphingomonadaceae bacterium]|uniref:Ketoreductase domain-containing protein n=1 Tax=uncultured Sphingomonadaceae bacterium TaxID=169976 RepID=A0A6J4TCA2_9SPHN|nr:MAG: hypothetical protein AVDCRST_MAG39-2390 [uncultured Sphingomonadaceae bacterium]
MNKRALAMAALLALAAPLGGCMTTNTELRARDARLVAGRTFVVTGASSGFGRGVAERLGAMRANVVLAARRTELLEEVAARVRAAGGRALVVTTDVSDPAAVDRLADAAAARFGRVDVWINNAGVGAIGRFEEIPVTDHARVVDVNFKGVVYGSHAALRRFRAQGGGTLVNVGSVESRIPLAYHASYAATKAAVLALGRALNEELRLNGLRRTVKVATVLPWAADTEYWANTANYSGRSPRMRPMDGPGETVDAIIYASLHPREELAVGWKAKGALRSHALFPDLTERIAGGIVHREQMKRGVPAVPTAGSLYDPNKAARGVEGGARARMKQEDEARREVKRRRRERARN